MKQSVTVGAQLLWSGRYGCNNGRYGCTIVMSYIEINKAVSQWLLTFNLCVSVTWPLTCAFHIPCTHTPEIIDMHRGMCDKCLGCRHNDGHPFPAAGNTCASSIFLSFRLSEYVIRNVMSAELSYEYINHIFYLFRVSDLVRTYVYMYIWHELCLRTIYHTRTHTVSMYHALHKDLYLHIVTKAKLWPFRRRRFQMHFRAWMKMFEFRLKSHWILFLRVQLKISQHWVR